MRRREELTLLAYKKKKGSLLLPCCCCPISLLLFFCMCNSKDLVRRFSARLRRSLRPRGSVRRRRQQRRSRRRRDAPSSSSRCYPFLIYSHRWCDDPNHLPRTDTTHSTGEKRETDANWSQDCTRNHIRKRESDADEGRRDEGREESDKRRRARGDAIQCARANQWGGKGEEGSYTEQTASPFAELYIKYSFENSAPAPAHGEYRARASSKSIPFVFFYVWKRGHADYTSATHRVCLHKRRGNRFLMMMTGPAAAGADGGVLRTGRFPQRCLSCISRASRHAGEVTELESLDVWSIQQTTETSWYSERFAPAVRPIPDTPEPFIDRYPQQQQSTHTASHQCRYTGLGSITPLAFFESMKKRILESERCSSSSLSKHPGMKKQKTKKKTIGMFCATSHLNCWWAQRCFRTKSRVMGGWFPSGCCCSSPRYW